MTKLIYVNLIGNLIPVNGDKIIRNGFSEFLEKNKNIALVAYTERETVDSYLKDIGLEDKFKQVYCIKDMAFMPQTGRHTPKMRVWTEYDFKTDLEDVLCISSDPRDIESSEWYRIKAIQVPLFENKEDSFSFDRIKVDSLSMHAAYFWQTVKGKPPRIVLK